MEMKIEDVDVDDIDCRLDEYTRACAPITAVSLMSIGCLHRCCSLPVVYVKITLSASGYARFSPLHVCALTVCAYLCVFCLLCSDVQIQHRNFFFFRFLVLFFFLIVSSFFSENLKIRCISFWRKKRVALPGSFVHCVDLESDPKVRAGDCNTAMLQRVKIVDATRVLAGPFATQLLADYGARVCKVEPLIGDQTRTWGPPFLEPARRSDNVNADMNATTERTAAYFFAANRNKQSLALDLKQQAGVDIVKDLVKEADVFIHNYLPSRIKAFQLDYDILCEINPRLIYCEITGWGSTGPRSNEPGYDMVAAAVGGFMHITGEQNGPPSKPGVAVTDLATGLFAHGAILAALLAREQTGHGQKIECSLFESQLAMLANVGANALMTGDPGSRFGTAHKSIVPYQVFETKDGHVAIAATDNKQFQTLASLLGKPEWATDERFKTNEQRVMHRNDLVDTITGVLKTRTLAEWCQIFEMGRTNSSMFAFGPINTVTEAFNDPQATARAMVQRVNDPIFGRIPLCGTPVKFSDTPAEIHSGPPLIGQHSRSILSSWLGYSEERLDELEAQGVIAQHPRGRR
eukprot:m.185060 g.185060  ORF g.185060 m.185060 type:complete len:576 (-) comp16679_c0_seq6:1139-2866(-)